MRRRTRSCRRNGKNPGGPRCRVLARASRLLEVARVRAAINGDIVVWRCRGWSQVRPGGVDLNARVLGDFFRQSRGIRRVHLVARTLGRDAPGDPVFRCLENRAVLASAC